MQKEYLFSIVASGLWKVAGANRQTIRHLLSSTRLLCIHMWVYKKYPVHLHYLHLSYNRYIIEYCSITIHQSIRLLQAQFDHLVNYLLARYEVPACMHRVWLMSDVEEARRQQGWFLHVAGGQNIGTAGIPMRITKRMAHIFTGEGEWSRWNGTIIMNLRSAQVAALGGSNELRWNVQNTILTSWLENEDFWESVVHFFVNNPMLEPSYAGHIIDYIRHQKYLPHER